MDQQNGTKPVDNLVKKTNDPSIIIFFCFAFIIVVICYLLQYFSSCRKKRNEKFSAQENNNDLKSPGESKIYSPVKQDIYNEVPNRINPHSSFLFDNFGKIKKEESKNIDNQERGKQNIDK